MALAPSALTYAPEALQRGRSGVSRKLILVSHSGKSLK
jgi:hypothetical protein